MLDLLPSRALAALADGSAVAAALSAPEGSEQQAAALIASGNALWASPRSKVIPRPQRF